MARAATGAHSVRPRHVAASTIPATSEHATGIHSGTASSLFGQTLAHKSLDKAGDFPGNAKGHRGRELQRKGDHGIGPPAGTGNTAGSAGGRTLGSPLRSSRTPAGKLRAGKYCRQPGGQQRQAKHLDSEQDAGRQQGVAPPAGQIPDRDGGRNSQGSPRRVEVTEPPRPGDNRHQREVGAAQRKDQRVFGFVQVEGDAGGSGSHRRNHIGVQDHEGPDVHGRQPAGPRQGKDRQQYSHPYQRREIPDQGTAQDGDSGERRGGEERQRKVDKHPALKPDSRRDVGYGAH